MYSGVYDAVSHFNYGQRAALGTIRLLNIDPGIYMTKSCGNINKKRKDQSIYKTLSPQKKRRKILRHSSKKRNDKVVEQEGKAGGKSERGSWRRNGEVDRFFTVSAVKK